VSFVRVAPLIQIPAGTHKSVRIGQQRIVVFNVGGALYAIEDACAHMKAPLSQGRLRGTELTCTWHGWTYDLTTGRRKGKGSICVRTYPVKVEGEIVLVDPSARASLDRGDEEGGEDELPALF
jgi:nitrite reductase/ring-hydroxylating ferredoxin subunit